MAKTIVKTEAGELLPELIKALMIVPKSSPMPVLENFMLEFRKGKGKSFVVATDLQQHYKAKIEAGCDEEVSFLVPAHLFTDLISNLKGLIDIEVLKTKITIKSSNGQYSLSISETEDYPELPKIEKKDAVIYENVLEEEFLKTLEEVEYAISNEDMRPAMCGVYVEPSKQAKFISTNGVLLSLRSFAAETIGSGEGFIIPKEAVAVLKKILPPSFTLTRSGSQAFFTDDKMTFSTRLIGEKYPKYENVIPKDNDKEIMVNRLELLTVIKRLKLFKDKPETGIVIRFSKGEMILKVTNSATGSTGTERIECKHNIPDDFAFGFSPDYLQQSLQSFESEFIKIGCSLPTKAIILSDPEHPTDIALLMPRRVDEEV
jgi:DNA polymerase-3 subunit beta